MFCLWCRPDSPNALRIKLWDSETTVGLEMAVLQPAHCVLARFHLLPLHLPAPLCAQLAGGSQDASDLLHLYSQAVHAQEGCHDLWHNLRYLSVRQCSLWLVKSWFATECESSGRLKALSRFETLLHIHFWGGLPELCVNWRTWGCLTASGLGCTSWPSHHPVSGQNPCRSLVHSHFFPEMCRHICLCDLWQAPSLGNWDQKKEESCEEHQ